MTTQKQKTEYFLNDSLANLEKDLRSLYTSETYEKFFSAHLEEIRNNIDDSPREKRQREKTRCILRKGGKLYGVGSTVVLAIVDAKDCTSEEDYHEISPDIHDDDLPNICEATDGALCWAGCTDRLADYFESNRTQDIYRLDSPAGYLDFNEKFLTLLNLNE